MTLRIQCVVVDSRNPSSLADFWEAALGWRRTFDDGDQAALEPPEGGDTPDLLFVRAPDPKATKNRLHLDLRPDDQQAEVARLTALGATPADIGQSDVPWTVLTDPEGNEFCILRPRPATD